MATTVTEPPAPRAAGLSAAEAERRPAETGPNAIEEAKGPSPARQLAVNFVQPLALLLWACAGIALLAEMPELSVAVALVVVVNALFSCWETYRAEQAVVTATGMQTRFGRIAALSQRTERERSPLQDEIDRVVRIVAALAVTIGGVFLLVSGLTHSWTCRTGSCSRSASRSRWSRTGCCPP